jgi:2-succinyl-5-enolpyruvyl-6-hydroxy-3-cyclohexene-1-carboxylate synthase
VSSQSIAAQVVATLNANGVTDFLLSPGSRSQALAIAAQQLEKAGLAKLTVRLDERSMAFTGLGIALASKKPVALIVTSGTAVANLFPVVLEANHAGVPLILLTADRPARLRTKGANQTTNQVNIFGSAAPCFDLGTEISESSAAEKTAKALQSALNKPGPVQLNVQFDLPLSSSKPDAKSLLSSAPKIALAAKEMSELAVPVDDHTIVIAGAGGERARAFAEAANLPLIAEPSSGSRNGANAVQFPIASLENLRESIRKVVVFGKPTLSRSVQRIISETSVYVEQSDLYGEFDPYGNVIAKAQRLIPEGQANKAWLEQWKIQPPIDERAKFVQFVWEKSERLVLGASDLIRVLDANAKAREIEVFSNRGLSGIDGTVSTAIGVAMSKGPTVALIGDLTLLHDANGLNKTDLPDIELKLVVGNDRGGNIFKKLEVANEIDEDVFTRLFRTPQEVDIAKLAQSYGWKYASCENLEELEKAWTLRGTVLIDYQLAD